MSVRVRYAPSPTGSPHVGNIRDALFKYLFARHYNGKMILRIEDTDRTRYVPGCENEIVESLKWLGIEWDEGFEKEGDFGPYRQSERKAADIYEKQIQILLDKGCAYKAFDTPDQLKEMREYQQINKQPIGYFGGMWRDATLVDVEKAERDELPGVIRLKMPRNETIVIEDAIRGRIEWDTNNVDDPVLIKADGMPTYHFAAMVDDHLMRMTHVIRGEEWISSAPKHAYLFDAFGWERPIFVHCPLIHGKDGKKLSKRHGDTRCLDFRAAGYLPDALINFIALIGWSPGEDRELLNRNELIEAFDLKGLQPSPGIFDLDKLNWMSGHYMRQTSQDDLFNQLTRYVNSEETKAYWSLPDHAEKVDLENLELLRDSIEEQPNYSKSAVMLEQERVQTLAEYADKLAFFFQKEPVIDPKAAEKWLGKEHVPALLQYLETHLTGKTEVTIEECREMLKKFAEQNGLEKMGPVVHPTRVTMTGKTVGPGLFELMSVLGPRKMLDRILRVKKQFL